MRVHILNRPERRLPPEDDVSRGRAGETFAVAIAVRGARGTSKEAGKGSGEHQRHIENHRLAERVRELRRTRGADAVRRRAGA